MEKPKSAIEAARAYGVDIEQLKWLRTMTATRRLRLMQSMAQFIVKGRASLQRQKERQR